jgi:hypothetical protein
LLSPDEIGVPGISSLRCGECPITIYGPDNPPQNDGEIKRCGQTDLTPCWVVRDVLDDGMVMEVDVYAPGGGSISTTLTGTLTSYTNSSLMTIQGDEYMYILNNGVISAIYSVE